MYNLTATISLIELVFFWGTLVGFSVCAYRAYVSYLDLRYSLGPPPAASVLRRAARTALRNNLWRVARQAIFFLASLIAFSYPSRPNHNSGPLVISLLLLGVSLFDTAGALLDEHDFTAQARDLAREEEAERGRQATRVLGAYRRGRERGANGDK